MASDFNTTRWSLVLRSRSENEVEARAALSELCEIYWYPLYAYVRRRGYPAEEALDLTQGLFTMLLEKDFVERADPERGRFRAYLLSSTHNFLAGELERANALKRGGGKTTLSFDAQEAEERYGREPGHELTPERLFERQWALTLLERTLRTLEEEYAARGKRELFEALRHTLNGEKLEPERQASLVETLGLRPGALHVAAHRLRKRYRERLHAEIAQTVADQGEVEAELRALFDALG